MRANFWVTLSFCKNFKVLKMKFPSTWQINNLKRARKISSTSQSCTSVPVTYSSIFLARYTHASRRPRTDGRCLLTLGMVATTARMATKAGTGPSSSTQQPSPSRQAAVMPIRNLVLLEANMLPNCANVRTPRLVTSMPSRVPRWLNAGSDRGFAWGCNYINLFKNYYICKQSSELL